MRQMIRLTVRMTASLLVVVSVASAQGVGSHDRQGDFRLAQGAKVSSVRGRSGGGGGHGHYGPHGPHGPHGGYGNGVGVDVVVPGYGLWGPAGGYGWSGPYGYQGYDPGSSATYHVVPAPVMPWTPPATYLPRGVNSPALEDAARENDEAWGKPLDVTPPTPKQILPPSTDQAKLASIRKEHAGDLQLRQRNYASAVERYREAVRLAEDRPDARFRLAIAETSRGNYEESIRELKTLYRQHPDWVMQAPTLDTLYGEDGLLAKTLVQERVISWVKEDIRDPDRLFLMGVILYYDNQFDRAETVLEAAARMGGPKPYLRSLLATLVESSPPAIGAAGAGANPLVPGAPGQGGAALPPAPNEP
ncbi:tetratricopeptide repeat protein [Maioricimonas sp. JC845]|uniref:tetratricopeptide repeat protein n=1 Tax=Maioricimonas sp. JC845 TaxID=3232138 RepID=UPI00345A9425